MITGQKMCDVGAEERESEGFEDTILFAFKIEEGAMSRGMQVLPRSC